MKTSQIILTTILFIAMFLWVSNINIQIKPFKISFGSLYSAIGFFLIIFGTVFLRHQGVRDGYKKGLKDGVEMSIDKVNDAFHKKVIELKEKKEEI